MSTCPRIDKVDGHIRAVLGIPKKKDLHPHLDRECLQIVGLATPSRRLKIVTRYIMRIEAKDHIFAPNHVIKGFISAKKGFGRGHIRLIFYRRRSHIAAKDHILPNI